MTEQIYKTIDNYLLELNLLCPLIVAANCGIGIYILYFSVLLGC